jgi:hypothetical protein
MTDLKKFLRASTRGLWGRERQTVKRELESHIRHRANRYEVSGSSHNDAIKLAIADLGAPREISAGMHSAYTIPNTIRACVIAVTLSSFLLASTQNKKHKPFHLPIAISYQHVATQIQHLRSLGLPVKISGWDNPKVTVRTTEGIFELPSRNAIPSSLYLDLISVGLENVILESADQPQYGSPAFRATPTKRLYKHKIFTPITPGIVVVVFSDEIATNSPSPLRRGFVTPINADGSFEYSSVSKTLTAVTGARNPNRPNGPGEITVVRFIDEYSTKPVLIEPIPAAVIKIESQ